MTAENIISMAVPALATVAAPLATSVFMAKSKNERGKAMDGLLTIATFFLVALFLTFSFLGFTGFATLFCMMGACIQVVVFAVRKDPATRWEIAGIVLCAVGALGAFTVWQEKRTLELIESVVKDNEKTMRAPEEKR